MIFFSLRLVQTSVLHVSFRVIDFSITFNSSRCYCSLPRRIIYLSRRMHLELPSKVMTGSGNNRRRKRLNDQKSQPFQSYLESRRSWSLFSSMTKLSSHLPRNKDIRSVYTSRKYYNLTVKL